MQRMTAFAFSAVLAAGLAVAPLSTANAATIDAVVSAAERINTEAKRSQAKIDELTEETRDLLSQYKTVLKEIEGLRVYNRQLERQIAAQEREMAQISQNIDRVTEVNRQVTPLMLRMIDGLEQFIELDMPFLLGERNERIEFLRETMDRADVSVSEKFNQVLQAYTTENEYGRTMEAYSDTISTPNGDQVVDVLRFGRIVLAAQSEDGENTYAFDKEARQWVAVDETFRTQVRNGIRMARKQQSVNLLVLPVPGPEDAQ